MVLSSYTTCKKGRNREMKKQTKKWMAMTMAVAMAATTVSSAVPGNGIIAEAASVRLSKTKLSLKVGQSKQLKVKGTKKAVKWSVSNGKIVKVTKKGKVTAKKAGTAKVYAKVKGKKLTCTVKVTAASDKKPTMSPSSSPAAGNTGNTGSTGSTGNTGSSSTKATATPIITPTVTTGSSVTPTPTNSVKGTEEPVLTPSVDPTETPTAEKIQIKVGKTKTATVDGVKFTYIFNNNDCFVKMENTTEDIKSVKWSLNALNADDEVVDTVKEENFYLMYLNAGKTCYEFVYDCIGEENQNVTSLEINNMQIQKVDSSYEDCLNAINIDVEKGKITKAGQKVTFTYSGDVSDLDKKDVELWGSIVYYDSDDKIVWVDDQKWEISRENDMEIVDELRFEQDEIAGYEVFLSAAYLENSTASDEPTPEPTDKPEPTASVKPTTKPTPTASVKPTETPDVEPIEVEVEDTKTATVDGVKFTYIAYDYELIVKMENTTEDSKSVSMTMDILDSDGNSLVGDSYVRTPSVYYLGAGQVCYDYGYCEQVSGDDEVASYLIESVTVGDTDPDAIDYLENIKVSSKSGKYDGNENITLTYDNKGEDADLTEGYIEVEGAIVFYDSDENVVDVYTIFESLTEERTEVTLELAEIMGEPERYEVILCGAPYYSNSQYEEEEKPAQTEDPVETDEPIQTEDPVQTEEPTETEEPKEINIQVGETKTVKKDGIEFTFITEERDVIVQYKNTLDSAKVIYVKYIALNAEGKEVETYLDKGHYISAGRSYYSYIYNNEDAVIANYKIISLEVEDPVGNSGDCIEDISVTPAKGKDMERNEWTFEYKGELSKVEGKTVCVNGAVVYYNSDNKIIGTRGFSENVKFSSEHTTGTFEISNPMTEADHYEVVLCGGECCNW